MGKVSVDQFVASLHWQALLRMEIFPPLLIRFESLPSEANIPTKSNTHATCHWVRRIFFCDYMPIYEGAFQTGSELSRLPSIPEAPVVLPFELGGHVGGASESSANLYEKMMSEPFDTLTACNIVQPMESLWILPPPLSIETTSDVSAYSMPTLIPIHSTPVTLSPRSSVVFPVTNSADPSLCLYTKNSPASLRSRLANLCRCSKS